MKKTLSILIAVIMGLFSFTACSSEAADSAAVSGGGSDIITEDDLEMTIDVPKTELKVGDSVTVTARIYNRSGEDIEIVNDIPEQEISIAIIKKGTKPQFTSTAIARDASIFKKDAYIEKIYEYTAESAGEYQVAATGCIEVKSADGVQSVSLEVQYTDIVVKKE